MTDDSTNHSYMCPICFASADETDDDADSQLLGSRNDTCSAITSGTIFFCKSPCDHIFCLRCVEAYILRPRSIESSADLVKNPPMKGKCPMCRTPFELFDLTRIPAGSPAYTKNSIVSSWPISGTSYKQRPYLSARQFGDLPMDLDRATEKRGAIGGYGIAFDFSSDKPRFITSSPLFASPDGTDCAAAAQAINREGEILHEVDFDTYHFFEKTMTFEGIIKFSTPVYQKMTKEKKSYDYDELYCFLQFSHNCEFVREGLLRWKLAPSTRTPSKNYALDGKWEVMWESGNTVEIFVQNHAFRCFGVRYELELDENNCPRFTWPTGSNGSEAVVQTSTVTVEPGASGSELETIDWATTDPGQGQIIWTRKSMDLSDCTSLARLAPSLFVYRRVGNGDDDDEVENVMSRPSYHAATLWGNTFCQAFTVGLASYHFVSPNAAYISYEHPQTSSWPLLDNGSAVPARVPWRNTSFDPETRTFRGSICWVQTYGTTWQGEPEWRYEIQFDPTYMYVTGGTCSRSQGPPHRFGDDLTYVNAALEDALRISREELGVHNTRRRFEAATGRTRRMLEAVFSSLDDDGHEGSIFDFNLSTS